jgi:hypothetical protein
MVSPAGALDDLLEKFVSPQVTGDVAPVDPERLSYRFGGKFVR